jgi:putative CocE/NonD family hydrolase
MFWPCSTDASAVTFSSPSFTEDKQITGHPVMHLWVTSTATDGNFFVALEDVSADGSVQVLTHGRMKASLRRLNPPPFDTMDLPWHRADQSDAMPMEAGTPTELIFTLEPTSTVIQSGHRLRLTVAGADPREPAFREEIHPAPMIEVLHDGVHNSFVSLPLVPIGAGIVPRITGSGK